MYLLHWIFEVYHAIKMLRKDSYPITSVLISLHVFLGFFSSTAGSQTSESSTWYVSSEILRRETAQRFELIFPKSMFEKND